MGFVAVEDFWEQVELSGTAENCLASLSEASEDGSARISRIPSGRSKSSPSHNSEEQGRRISGSCRSPLHTERNNMHRNSTNGIARIEKRRVG